MCIRITRLLSQEREIAPVMLVFDFVPVLLPALKFLFLPAPAVRFCPSCLLGLGPCPLCPNIINTFSLFP